jgi:SAM-dependent methyltransferase
MTKLAREFNQDVPGCSFVLNDQDSLAKFQDDSFGFVYTSIVLQHIAGPYNKRYIAELIRVLKPGGVLVFQVPDQLRENMSQKLRTKLAIRSRLRRLLRKSYLMEMHCISEAAIRELVQSKGARVIDVCLTNSTDPSFSGDLQYLKTEPQAGYVSKQYCVVKHGGEPGQ